MANKIIFYKVFLPALENSRCLTFLFLCNELSISGRIAKTEKFLANKIKIFGGLKLKITGLTDAQVQENKAQYGDNSITEQAREGKLKGNDPIIKILIFALCLNIFFAKDEWCTA